MNHRAKSAFFLCTLAFLFFASQWTARALKPNTTYPPGTIKLYANKDGDPLKEIYLAAILRAKEKITLIVYSLRDEAILAALNQKAKEGCSLKVFVDGKASLGVRKKLDPSIAFKTWRGRGLMHIKMLAVDSDTLFIGSANMTKESLLHHDNLVLAVCSLNISSLAEAIFKGEAPQKSECGNLTIYLFPEERGGEEIVARWIQSAKKSIDVAMYTFTNERIINELLLAKSKIPVSLVVDQNSLGGKERPALLSLNPKIQSGKTLMHHKFMVIDQKTLLMGSANYTKAAFSINQDCLVIYKEMPQVEQEKMQRVLKKLHR